MVQYLTSDVKLALPINLTATGYEEMKIPLIAIERQNRSIEAEIKKEIIRVVDEGFFVLGKNMERFEQEFAKYCGSKFSVGVANGTDAILIALKAAGIEKGDEVLVPANTFIATAEAVTHAGARPVFVDIDPKTFNINIEAAKVNSKTKAVIPVHLYGQSADMGKVIDFARRFDLKVIEDASQAHGSTFNGQKVGSIGAAGCFSLFPTKPLGAMGDAGIITTDDEEIAVKAKQLRNHGRSGLNSHVVPGYTSRLDEIQAAILLVKLKYLDRWNEERKRIAESYDTLLGQIPQIQVPYCISGVKHVYYLYVIRVAKRDELKEALSKKGIQALIHYPTPIHLQPAYNDNQADNLKFVEQVSREILSLPMFAELNSDEVTFVCDAINEWIGKHA
ncbi:MAG: DegT/DnrJ/EryC1/StrS family aminotransferase [Candidatus Bathyarchaeota archaeon]|nr:DegT/DnrJ/EryC1/StrS family aminotransferase [Candidatus Bathyarchaeota archaeon]